ncbi:MAG: methyltransferase [Calditrichaeota bacterium]|nr:methyltransferase [Calditrichota bacterium]
MIAKTFSGLEEVLAEELQQLGAQDIQVGKRAVSFWGNQELLYRANLYLRTALRILKPVAEFTVEDETDLYRGIRGMDWSAYLDVEGTLAVDGVVKSDRIRHSKYLALKVKDAIADQFREKFGRRPSVDVSDPTLRLNVYLYKDRCTVSLDSSGESLHRRGYRLESMQAPLNEVLAAGMILLSGWNRHSHFVDPMCGSGTIVIEAALYALNLPPNGQRKTFGFMKWKDFNSQLWQHVLGEVPQHKRSFDFEIVGADRSARALRVAKENIKRAGLEGVVTCVQASFESFLPPEGEGVLITNPPYGERMKKEAIGEFYKMIGDHLKQAFNGYDAWILSANRDALKRIGLRASQRHTLYNGGLLCKFQKYSMYAGSKKRKSGVQS